MSGRHITALLLCLTCVTSVCWAAGSTPSKPAAPPAAVSPAPQVTSPTPGLGPSPISVPPFTPGPPPAASGVCLTLDDAVSIALRSNPRVSISRDEITANQGLLIQARGALLPRLSMTVQRTQSVSPPPGTVSFQATGPSWATTITLLQPLYTWGSLQAALQAARDTVFSAQSTYTRTQDQVVFAARTAYYQMLTAQESVRVQQDSLEAAAEHRRIAGLRLEAGVAPEYDVLAADARVASVQQALAPSQGISVNAWATPEPGAGLRDSARHEAGRRPAAGGRRISLAAIWLPSHSASRADIVAEAAQASAAQAQLAVAKTGNLAEHRLHLAVPSFPIPAISASAGENIVVSAKMAFIGLGATWTPFDADQTHGKVVTANSAGGAGE